MTDLERAYAALQAKQRPYDTAWNFYDGLHPLVYSAERLREIFRGLDARFSENWCAVVVDSMADRLQLKSWLVAGDEAATAELNRLWQATELNLDFDDTLLATLVCGEGYIIAWPGDEAGRDPEAYYNDPRLSHVFYDAEKPRRVSFAAKWWVDEEQKRRLTLYYPERLEYYVSRNKADNVSSARAFQPAEPASAPNPTGAVPVFHFRRTRRRIQSELANVIEPQNAVNKLLADMMVAAEFGAFKQRWVISNADLGTLRNAPNEIWSIPAGDGAGQGTQVGQFDATELKNYLDAINELASHVAIISRTPKHYLLQQGGDPSGEALIAMEAPLNKKCQKFIAVVRPVAVRLAVFLLGLAGVTANEADVTPVFAPPETVQPKTQAEIREANVRAGLPLATVLRDEGWTEQELADLQQDKAEEQAAAQASLAAALVEQQRRFDQEQEGTDDRRTGNGSQPGGRRRAAG